MQPASDDARVRAKIAALATLYDAFANAIDPFAPERDEAERVFSQEVAEWHDSLADPKPLLHEFRKGIIRKCKEHLAATNKPSGI
jgi:hypothetical protein